MPLRALRRRTRQVSFALACVVSTACVERAPNVGRGARRAARGVASEPNRPLLEPSEEATNEQLRLALEQGAAEDAALRYLLDVESAGGGTVAAGDFEISAALLAAGAMPTSRAHLAVAIRDGADHRLVPHLDARATLRSVDGAPVWQGTLAFVCDPLLHHYGASVDLPGPGPYALTLEIEPLSLHRHDPVNGDRYATKVHAVLDGLRFDDGARGDDEHRQRLARAQGFAVQHALTTMLDGVAVDGAETRVGDYFVAYAVEFAEGYWSLETRGLVYHTEVDQSAERNAHVEVAVRDAATGRFVPWLDVAAELFRDGERVGQMAQPLMWHPWLYHYGANWRIPSSGSYDVVVRIGPSSCAGRDGALRRSNAFDVRFDGARLRTGEK